MKDLQDIEEVLASTLAQKATAVPSPTGLTEKIRLRHTRQRRRRAMVTVVSGIAAVTLVSGGVAVLDLQPSGGTPAGIMAAADPDPSSAPSSQPVGMVPWPTRGNGSSSDGRDWPEMEKEWPDMAKELSAMWNDEPGMSFRGGTDIEPLGKSPRILGELYAATMPAGNVIVLQGTDETQRAMLAVFEVKDDLRLISRGPVDKYKASSSTDVLRFVTSERVHLLTPPSATAGVSETPVSDGTTPVFTPIPLDDGLLTMPLKGGKWAQVQVQVGSTIVYQGPIAPN
jgi:hypothetical protein